MQSNLQNCVTLYPVAIAQFSSQYGSESGSSYIVRQLIGKPQVFPQYGDFTEACVFRTYGSWWKSVPSAVNSVGFHKPPADYCTQDFVEVVYQEHIILGSVHIYETFNPGCAVRIFACDTSHVPEVGSSLRWVLVWQRPAPIKEPHKAKLFEPKSLVNIDFPTNRLRVEFNSDLVEYYTEIDTISISGMPFYSNDNSGLEKRLLQSLSGMSLQDRRVGPSGDQSDEDRVINLSNSLFSSDDYSVGKGEGAGLFFKFPTEVILRILHHLNLPSLMTLARCSKFFWSLCSDPSFYVSVSFKPYCLRVCDLSLLSITPRCQRLTELDISWCGADAAITPAGFLHMFSFVGNNLKILRLADCHFLTDDCLISIGKLGVSLKELDLSGCNGKNVSARGFTALTRLNQLERLNLYRCSLDIHAIVSIVRVNSQLQHLCLGSCSQLRDCDTLATTLGHFCPNLISADFWRCSSLTHMGLQNLADGCTRLEELDFGWCTGLDASTGCFKYLVGRCHFLKKLYLTANRTVTDRDLDAIANYCPLLQQLDILGTRDVSVNGVLRVLKSCPQLQMFDVSFCNGIKMEAVRTWRSTFPHCSIQMSFQSTMENSVACHS